MKSSYWVRVGRALSITVNEDSRSPGGPRLNVQIIFETHSTSVDNERGIATGWLDGELSEHGREQARRLGERRRDDGISAVFASDLGRAVETAEIAFLGSGIPIRYDPRLRECNYGELNGMPRTEIEKERSRRIDVPYPGGESYRDVVARVSAFLDDLASEHDGERVVVIGHAATRWALDHLLAGTPLEDFVGPFEWQEGWAYTLRRRSG